jgi:predicted aspartyl protease
MIRLGIDRRRVLLTAAACALAPSGLRAQTEDPEDIAGSADLMTAEDRFRRMTVPVTIDGRGPFPFSVDTGANRSVLSRELAEELGLPAAAPINLHGIAGTTKVAAVRIDRLELGKRTMRRLVLPVMERRHLETMGFFGVDRLSGQRLLMDFSEGRLELDSSKTTAPDPLATAIPARQRFGQLTILDTGLRGERVSVLIDSGSQCTAGNLALLRLANGGRDDGLPLVPTQVIGATGDIVPARAGELPPFRIGALMVRRLQVVFADLHPFSLWGLERTPAMLLGIDVLRQFATVSLDYGRREVRFRLQA